MRQVFCREWWVFFYSCSVLSSISLFLKSDQFSSQCQKKKKKSFGQLVLILLHTKHFGHMITSAITTPSCYLVQILKRNSSCLSSFHFLLNNLGLHDAVCSLGVYTEITYHAGELCLRIRPIGKRQATLRVVQMKLKVGGCNVTKFENLQRVRTLLCGNISVFRRGQRGVLMESQD